MGFFDKLKRSYFRKFEAELNSIPSDAEYVLYGELELDVYEANGWREVFEGMGLICVSETELFLKPIGQTEVRLAIADLQLEQQTTELNVYIDNSKYELEQVHSFTEIAPAETLLPSAAQAAGSLADPKLASLSTLLIERGAQIRTS